MQVLWSDEFTSFRRFNNTEKTEWNLRPGQETSQTGKEGERFNLSLN